MVVDALVPGFSSFMAAPEVRCRNFIASRSRSKVQPFLTALPVALLLAVFLLAALLLAAFPLADLLAVELFAVAPELVFAAAVDVAFFVEDFAVLLCVVDFFAVLLCVVALCVEAR